jgi:hypothetical protein
MSKFNAFRPAICEMENRTLLSAAFAASALPAEPVPYKIELENVLISSYQTSASDGAGIPNMGTGTVVLAGDTTAIGSSGMSAGKVSYSDLSVMISLEKNEVGDSFAADTQPQTANQRNEMQIQSWSLGATNPTAVNEETGYRYELEDVIISGVRVDPESTSREASAPSISEIVVTKVQDTASSISEIVVTK